jgi:hypothetical protein
MGTYKEVLGVDVAMLWEVEVLLGHEYALPKQVLRSVSRCPSKYVFEKVLRRGFRWDYGRDLDDTNLVDLLAVRFWDQHCRESLALFGRSRTM